jgi:hypothetical protein
MALCDCNLTLANTGANKCTPVFGVGVIPVLVPLVAADGTANQIDLTTYTGSQAEWDALTENPDRTKRWYPLPKVKNVENVRGDAVFESFDDGSNEFVRQGTRTYQAELTGKKIQVLGNLEGAGCAEVGIVFVDDCKQLIANKDGDFANPIPIDGNTWQVNLVLATGSTVNKLQLNFEFDSLAKDSDLGILEASASIIDLTSLKGLSDMAYTFGAITATDAKITLTTSTLSMIGVPIEGITQPDWSAFNVTDNSIVAIPQSSEGVGGEYTVDFLAQTPGDIIQLSAIYAGCELYKAEFTAV